MKWKCGIKLSELIAGLDAKVTGDADVEITHLEYDSRLITEGSLFFAITGYKQDGYSFAKQASEKGAVAVMGERDTCDYISTHITVSDIRQAMSDVSARFYGYPGDKIKACGVTGTNGKTTTCHILKVILEQRNKTVGLVCSTVYDTGKETFPAERTTPESLDLQRLLFLMKKNYCVNAVIEVSSHALVLKRVENINFRVAIFTNITRDHLDFHDNMEDYLKAKALLISKVVGELSYIVINLDVPEFRKLFGEFNSSFMTYSLESNTADVYCSNFELQRDKTIFDLVTPMGSRTVTYKLPGRFNLINAIAAAAGGLASGVDIDNVMAGLEKVESIPGRFEPIIFGQPFGLFVDFAHTPDAIERLCQSARELTGGRLLLLFGCGGDRDKGKRPLMGKAATTNADIVVVTSDNPRGEEPESIIEDIKPGLVGENWSTETDRKRAIRRVLEQAQPDDLVLLAGKGAENYQEIKGQRYPFDDANVAKAILGELGLTSTNMTEGN